MSDFDEPYPGYRYDAAGAERAARALAAARKAMLEHGDGSLFDTEPQLIQKTLAALAPEDTA
ncbi:MAG: hypothetical protein RIM80_12700 [Alphaproteobacteria bacterium]